MLTSSEINTVGQLLNTTWGSSFNSSPGDWPRGSATPTSMKGSMVTASDGTLKLVIAYTDFVTFGNDQEIIATKKKFRSIAEKACESFLKNVKSKFRENESRALKVKFSHDTDSVETIYSPVPEVSLIGAPRYRPPMYRGYYRYTCVYNLA